jgi:hypothetical protein
MSPFNLDLKKGLESVPANPDIATLSFLNAADTIAKIENYNQNREERKTYAFRIYCFTCCWCVFVGIIVVLTGLGILQFSDLILTTLLGSTTVNVFAFFYLVTQYLFNKEKST